MNMEEVAPMVKVMLGEIKEDLDERRDVGDRVG
jgi:hypothetical protein